MSIFDNNNDSIMLHSTITIIKKSFASEKWTTTHQNSIYNSINNDDIIVLFPASR